MMKKNPISSLKVACVVILGAHIFASNAVAAGGANTRTLEVFSGSVKLTRRQIWHDPPAWDENYVNSNDVEFSHSDTKQKWDHPVCKQLFYYLPGYCENNSEGSIPLNEFSRKVRDYCIHENTGPNSTGWSEAGFNDVKLDKDATAEFIRCKKERCKVCQNNDFVFFPDDEFPLWHFSCIRHLRTLNMGECRNIDRTPAARDKQKDGDSTDSGGEGNQDFWKRNRQPE